MTETALVPQNGNTTTEIVSQFGTTSGFELLQRQAQMLANSSMVPEQFSIFDKVGKPKPAEMQKYAVANSVIALEISHRIGASPLMVAQNLVVIYGRPTWSSQFVIAAINASGRFSSLRFRLSDPEPEKDVTYSYTEYVHGNKQNKTGKVTIKNRECVAWTYDKATSEVIEGPPVSLEMAVKEGWYSKSGSKWQTMPELMLRYRAAAFFGRLYAPDVLMGMRSVDEAIDVGDDVIDVEPEPSKVADINAEIKAAKMAAASQKKTEPEAPAEQQATIPEQKQPESTLEPNPDQSGAIPKQILKEMAEIDGKNTVDSIDMWLFKHHTRCLKLHGETWWKFISDHAERRRAFLNAEPAPGETVPAIVVNGHPEGVVMIACPEAGGRMIPKSDCDTGDCSENCHEYQVVSGGKKSSKLTMEI